MYILLNKVKKRAKGIMGNKYYYALIFAFFFSLTATNYATEKDPFLGYWMLTNNRVVIQIERENETYVGYVRWLKELHYPENDPMAGEIQTDRKNPDATLRNRPVLGLKVVGDLVYNEKNEQLEKGWIYDSWNGRLYHGRVSLVDENTLKLIGSFDKYGILRRPMTIKRVEFKNKN